MTPPRRTVVRVEGATLGSHAKALPTKHRSPLLRGLYVLELVGERPRSVSQIAEALEVNRSTALRLLQELHGAGYVTRDDRDRTYALAGQPPTRLDRATESEQPEVPTSSEWLEDLHSTLSEIRDVAGETTIFAVPARDRMLYASFFPTDHPIGVQESIGSARPMNASAVGKAYLAALEPTRLDIVLGRLSYTEGTDRAARRPIQLRDMLDEVRTNGYAIDHDETFEGVSCVAVAVVVSGSFLAGSAGITGPTHRFPEARVKEFVTLLIDRLHPLSN